MASSSIISIIVAVINLVPIVIYFTRRNEQEPVLRLLALMLILRFVTDVVSITAMIVDFVNAAHVVGNFYSVFETMIIIMMYRLKFNESIKSYLFLLMAGLVGMEIFQMIVTPGIFAFPILSRMVFSVAVGLLAISYFFKLLKDLPAVHVYKVPMFWINSGLLVYFAGSFFLFISKDYMVTLLANDRTIYWGYHNFLAILSYVLYSIAFLQRQSRNHSGR